MIKKINDFRDLRQLLVDTLCTGRRISFSQDDKPQNLALMFNYIRNDGGKVAVANRIFEIRLYNLFILEESRRNPEFNSAGSVERSLYVKDGRLDMDTVMERFSVHYADLFGHRHAAFAEADVVFADPLFEPVCPAGTTFIRHPHEAFSGRCFSGEIRNFVCRELKREMFSL